jgi:outer membrane protein assembly factor BamB
MTFFIFPTKFQKTKIIFRFVGFLNICMKDLNNCKSMLKYLGGSNMKINILAMWIVFLFIFAGVSPMVFGITIEISYKELPQSSIPDERYLTNSVWPMYKHDSQRSGRSSYDTSNNPGIEKWTYYMESGSDGSIAIDRDGNIYAVSNSEEIYALYPNGTKKWEYKLPTPYPMELVLGQDGTIFVGTTRGFYALNLNGTLKWTLDVGGEKNYVGYPTIDANGTVYVGTADGYLYAIYPNGTLKWEYKINYWVSASAVDKQGNIYFASRNKRVYCLNSNGTLRWRTREIEYFDNGPVIDDNGTIYLSPRTDWLYAYYPNGTEKWRTDLPDSEGMPSIAPNGNIIVPGRHYYIMALEPSYGNILWKHPVEDNYDRFPPSVIGADGTVYFAYSNDEQIGYMCALNPDGSLKWKTSFTSDIQPYSLLSTYGAPAIGADGTVYVVSKYIREDHPTIYGYVHAFGELDANAPSAPMINGPTNGGVNTDYNFTISSSSPLGRDVYYFIDWDDDSVEKWIGPYSSGEDVTVSHKWSKMGIYTIRARAKDTDNLWGSWSSLNVIIPRDKSTNNIFLLRLLERFPLLQKLIQL